jgi:molybdate transport system ATP-binding protein
MRLRAVSVRRSARWVLREISWDLAAGQRWALLGANGAGKTQLMKVLSGAVWPTPASDGAGVRQYALGEAMLDLTEAMPRIAYVGAESQDKYARYGWDLPVSDLVATGLHGTDLLLRPITPAEAATVRRMVRVCHLTRLTARRFLTLSYGEKRLVLLARALVGAPDWLLLDEFYNGLDQNYRRRIEAVLAQAHRRGQAWVASAHRAADVPRGTEWLLKLKDGRVAELGRLKPAHVRQLKQAASETGLAGVWRRRAVARSLIELRDVDLFVEYRAVLRDVNWQLNAGDHWAVVGENGAGKSSFLKLLYGDLAPALGGLIRRAGMAPGTPIAAWKRGVGLVSPELQTLYLIDASLLELVASGEHASIGLNEPMTRGEAARARRWLKFFKLASFAQRRPRELSYGQLRRALVARAMMAAPRLLLLDEPLTGLDPMQRALMKRLLARLMRRGVSVVIAVHHLEDLPAGITHLLRLHKRQAYASDFHSAK